MAGENPYSRDGSTEEGGSMLISDEYRELNAQLHATRPDYGISSHKWPPIIRRYADTYGCKSILDYGSGKGLLKQGLDRLYSGVQHPPKVFEYDPAVRGLQHPPQPADMVVCTDVLEHIEPECLDDVIDHIFDLAYKMIFVSVALVPATKTLSDGRNAHLIIQPANWWRNKLNKYGLPFLHEGLKAREAVYVIRVGVDA